jgi:hypothetical protein
MSVKLNRALRNPKDPRNYKTILDAVIEKSGSFHRLIQMAREIDPETGKHTKSADSVFLDILDKRLKLEPKDVQIDNNIVVTFKHGTLLPRPEREIQAELIGAKCNDNRDIEITDSDIDASDELASVKDKNT